MTKLIEVTFTSDFAPYGIKKGAKRKVSESAAHKLYEVYGVIDDPFNKLPLVVNIKLLAKVQKYGAGWYPYSEHLVTGQIARELIEQGLAELAGSSAEQTDYSNEGQESGEHSELHSSFCYKHPNIEGIAYWFNSPHNFENENQKINAISVAVQCSRTQAEKIYKQILELN